MIYTRFGNKIEVVRRATVADVRKFDNRRPDKEDRVRTADGWRAICRYLDGREFLADVAFLKADGGYGEIHDAFKTAGAGRPEA